MIFTTEKFLEVAIESLPELDLNSQLLNSNRLSYQVMSSTRTQNQLCTASPILSFIQCSDFISAIAEFLPS